MPSNSTTNSAQSFPVNRFAKRGSKLETYFFPSHYLHLQPLVEFLAFVFIPFHFLFGLAHFLLQHVQEGTLLDVCRHFHSLVLDTHSNFSSNKKKISTEQCVRYESTGRVTGRQDGGGALAQPDPPDGGQSAILPCFAHLPRLAGNYDFGNSTNTNGIQNISSIKVSYTSKVQLTVLTVINNNPKRESDRNDNELVVKMYAI